MSVSTPLDVLKSPTPDWKLESFSWLKHKDWKPETILMEHGDGHRYYCKICDVFVARGEAENHVEAHIVEDDQRKERSKAEARAKADAEKAEAMDIPVEEYRKQKQRPAPVKRGSHLDTTLEVVVDFIKTNGESTLQAIVDKTGLPLSKARTAVMKSESIVVVGHVKSGGRGRPANIFGLANSKKGA